MLFTSVWRFSLSNFAGFPRFSQVPQPAASILVPCSPFNQNGGNMTKINLRDHYPDFYNSDCIIEVPEEVAAIMLEHDRLEAAYRRRTYYHNAHYSLDRGDGI